MEPKQQRVGEITTQQAAAGGTAVAIIAGGIGFTAGLFLGIIIASKLADDKRSHPRNRPGY